MRSLFLITGLFLLTLVACSSSKKDTDVAPVGEGTGGATPVASGGSPSVTDPVLDSGTATKPDGGQGGQPEPVETTCGANDNPETGIQGDAYPGTVNCGLTLLSAIPGGGSAQGSDHCVYVRGAGAGPYFAGPIRAFSIADPLDPVKTDDEPGIGGSESMRARTVSGRAILVSGSGVYDISNCEDIVKKGDIPWPSQNAQAGFYMAALSSHEISISNDAMRVYTGLGFAIAYIEDLERPETWFVKDWRCELSRQSDFAAGAVMSECEGPVHPDVGRQYSHASDENLEGTVWYGAGQGSFTSPQPPTARIVDISDRESVKILDTLPKFPGHSMNWWRTPDGREFVMGVNEGLGNRCMDYPRPVDLGWALDINVVEVTGNKYGKPFTFTLDINKPENCLLPGSNANVSGHTVYNKNGAAFVMIEFAGAGLRVFDLRDGDNPKEVAYYNDGGGFTHSATFHYDEARGIMISSGRAVTSVVLLQPQIIEALGLPEPTDPGYPYL